MPRAYTCTLLAVLVALNRPNRCCAPCRRAVAGFALQPVGGVGTAVEAGGVHCSRHAGRIHPLQMGQRVVAACRRSGQLQSAAGFRSTCAKRKGARVLRVNGGAGDNSAHSSSLLLPPPPPPPPPPSHARTHKHPRTRRSRDSDLCWTVGKARCSLHCIVC